MLLRHGPDSFSSLKTVVELLPWYLRTSNSSMFRLCLFELFLAAFRREKPEAQTNNELCVQLSECQKLRKDDFICKAEELIFPSFLRASLAERQTSQLTCSRNKIIKKKSLVHSKLIRLADSYRCQFVYIRKKYYWLIHVNSVLVRRLASPASQPLPAELGAIYCLWKHVEHGHRLPRNTCKMRDLLASSFFLLSLHVGRIL